MIIKILIKFLDKITVLFMIVALAAVMFFGTELISWSIRIPSWVVLVAALLIAALWAIVDTVLEKWEGDRWKS